MHRFEEVKRRQRAAMLEREIRAFWDEQNVFERSVAERAGGRAYTFYEGPPTANGMPGIHHVMARTIKDVFCRFHTMKGCRVERKAGWDTHGLPVEIEVEKALGLDGHDDIKRYGIARFNDACRDSVLAYKGEWDRLTRMMGYWVDLDRPYITFETPYIESVWWLLKQIFDRGLLYRGHKIQWYSPGSETVLSSHEVSLGYKEVQDPSVTVRFRSRTRPNTFYLAWTTTPWTLVSNAALAVGPDVEYVAVRCASAPDRLFILAAACVDMLQQEYTVEHSIRGHELVGERYEPLFDWYEGQGHVAWRIVPAGFVSTGDGTGIVHIAPAFGADDHRLGTRHDLPTLNPIDRRGRFLSETPLVGGMWFKQADRPITRDLRRRGLLHRHDTCVHNYPFDWRKGTPLMSYPVESWFIRTTAIRERLCELNDTINWQPESIGRGRFGAWLEGNVDWALSRRRFWGTPLPIWVSDRDPSSIEAIGSIAELRARCGDQLPDRDEDIDLHRPFVDELTWPAPDGGTMRRVPETIDVWFDSGAMPFAQWHYPFANQDVFERSFPADFISEGVDQTRGWFYTLHAIAALVTDQVAFKNCVVGGLLLDKAGEKMSKSRGNSVDPFEIIEQYGADRVRWYLMSNSPPWEDLKFNVRGIEEAERKVFGTLSNIYQFFATYANIDGFTGAEPAPSVAERRELDRWILSRLHSTITEVEIAYAAYHPTRAARAMEVFVNELSNWYIRRSRRRFWTAKGADASVQERDKWAAYHTVRTSLDGAARMIAPIAPHYSDWLYTRLHASADQSVHLADFPTADTTLIDLSLEARMRLAQSIASVALGLRNQAKVNIRQPVAKLIVVPASFAQHGDIDRVTPIILEEVNAHELEILSSSSALVRRSAKPNFRALGRRAGRRMPRVKAAIEALTDAEISTFISSGALEIDADGEALLLGAEDIEVSTEGIEGWIVGQDDGVTVALDTRITEALRHEGLARECINRIQNMRKTAGYHVTDRIHVHWSAQGSLARAMDEHSARIRNETLALTLDPNLDSEGELTESFLIGGESVTITIRRPAESK